MELREWITLVIVPGLSAIAAGTTAVWLWFTKSYLPAKRAQQERLDQANIERLEDTREFVQATETASLSTLIEVVKTLLLRLEGNEQDNRETLKELRKLRDDLLKKLNEFHDEMRSTRGELQKLSGNVTLHTMELSGVREAIEDVGLVNSRLEGVILGREEKR